MLNDSTTEAQAERREIPMRARPLGAEAAEISIEDQGPGIAPDVLPSLSEPLLNNPKGRTGPAMRSMLGSAEDFSRVR